MPEPPTPPPFTVEGYVNVQAVYSRGGEFVEALKLAGVTQRPGAARDIVASVRIRVRIPRSAFTRPVATAEITIPEDAVRWEPVVEVIDPVGGEALNG